MFKAGGSRHRDAVFCGHSVTRDFQNNFTVMVTLGVDSSNNCFMVQKLT